MVVSIGEDDYLRNFGSTHRSDDSLAIKHLADLLRCGRHEFNLSGRTVLSGASNEGPSDPGPLDTYGTRESCENSEWDAGEDQVIEPREALTDKLTGELFAE
jgi:hypothetical protein